MNEIEIYLLGYPLLISYQLHDPNYVEWKLKAHKTWEDEFELLNVLLRIHYSAYIEAACREHHFYEEYARSAGWKPMGEIEEDIPF